MSALPTLLRRFTLRYYSHDWLRALLTLLGVGLGLSVVVAIQIANRTALSSFENFTDTIGSRATYSIRSNGPPLDETVLQKLAWARGEAHFAPVLRATALVRAPQEEVLEVTGLDLLQDWQFAPTADAAAPNPDFAGLVVDPQAVFVADTLATRLQLKVDKPLVVVMNGHSQTLMVRGIIPTHGHNFDDSVVIMDIAAAQIAMERPGVVDRIDVKLAPWVKAEDFLRRAQATLPSYLSISPPGAVQRQAQKMTQAFQLNLTALSMVALMVGLFLIYDTVAVSVVRRRPEIGIMRALGTSSQQIFALFLLEGATLGLVGSLLGLLFGWGLSFSAVKAVAETVDLLYVPTRPAGPHLEPWLAVACVVLGVGMALASSYFPAREAASVAPVEAMGRGAQNLLLAPDLKAALGYGTGLLAMAAVLCKIPPVGGLPLGGFAACLLVLLSGTVLAAPMAWLVSLLLKRPLVGTVGASGMAAVTHLLGALKRIGVAVGALTVGMAMVTSVAIMIHSFRETVVAWINQTVRADIFITAAENRTTTAHGMINPDAVRQIRALPGIRSSDAFYGLSIQYEEQPAWLGAADLSSIGQFGHLSFLQGDSEAIILSCVNAPRVIVSEPFSTRHHVHQGQTLTLQGTQGPVSLTIAGVYYDYSTEAGWIVMDKSTYERWFGPTQATNLAIYLQPGVSAEAFKREVRRTLGTRYDLDIQTSGNLRGEVIRVFNQTFAVTDSIEIIAIVVAVLGVVTTLFALILERRQDIAILRCLGTTQSQILIMVLIEAFVIALCGVSLGLGTGFGLAWVLIYVINKQSFGWTLMFHFPAGPLAEVVAVILIVTVFAAGFPARLAAQVEPAKHLRNE